MAKSWQRSLAAGVVPDSPGAPVRFGPDELAAAREDSPLAPTVEAIFSTLSSLDDDAHHVVAIGDAEANLLWVTGEAGTCERAREMRFEEGAAWSESMAGTNAVGTAAALDHPVQIFSAEHLVAAVHPWTCSAAPIHEPATGELIGVVDVTAGLRTNHPHTLSLAALAARAAETSLHLRSLEIAERLRKRWEAAIVGRRSPSVLVDARGRVIASRGVDVQPGRIDLAAATNGTVTLPDERVAAELQPLEDGGAILWLRRRAPAGLSSAVATARPQRDRPARDQTRRARAALTRTAGHTRDAPGRSDRRAARTRTLRRARQGRDDSLASPSSPRVRGRVRAADTALPFGHPDRCRLARRRTAGVRRPAPRGAERLSGVVAARVRCSRDRRSARSARGVVAALDPYDRRSRAAIALARSPAGADDAAAARTLVAVLPRGSPRRAAATATFAAIARRISQGL